MKPLIQLIKDELIKISVSIAIGIFPLLPRLPYYCIYYRDKVDNSKIGKAIVSLNILCMIHEHALIFITIVHKAK